MNKLVNHYYAKFFVTAYCHNLWQEYVLVTKSDKFVTFRTALARRGKVWKKWRQNKWIKVFVSITRKSIVVKKIDFLSKDISNLNNSFFKHYLRIKSYNFMQKFSRRECVVYFKNMFEFLNHSKFSKGCVARSLCPIFMIDPSNDSSRWGQQFYNPLFL